MSTVADSIQDTLGVVTDVEENSLMLTYYWDEEVDCNLSGELYFWGSIEDAWGQKTMSQPIEFTEQPPSKPSITSIYYESIEDKYVIEWNMSLDDDFQSYTVYYKHTSPFSQSDIYDESCNDSRKCSHPIIEFIAR